MTRKHFRQIAAIVAELPDEYRRGVAYQFAAMCAELNPRFDRAKFLTACGVE